MDNVKNVTVRSIWYALPPKYRHMLKLLIGLPGCDISVVLSPEEMEEWLLEIRHDGMGDDTKRGHTRCWWEYEAVIGDGEEVEGYSLGGEMVQQVPLVIYRDDHFHVSIPHETAIEIGEIIEDRLAEVVTGTAAYHCVVQP